MPVDNKAKDLRGSLAEGIRHGEKLALVIPTLNEAGSLRSVLDRVLMALDPVEVAFEVLIVDDDSRDGTEEVVAAVAQEDSRVRLLVRKDRKGLSGAILHGWESTDAGILGVMDADLQHPPELLPELVRALLNDGKDLVIGSRYARGGRIGDWNPIRRLISHLGILATWPIQRRGLRASDPLSGFFLVRRRCVANMAFRTTGFKLLLEILVRGHVESMREVPIVFGRRSAGRSKASLRVAWEYVLLMVELYGSRRNAAGVQEAESSGD